MTAKLFFLLAAALCCQSLSADEKAGRIIGGIELPNSSINPAPSIVAVLIETPTGAGRCGVNSVPCAQLCGGVYLGGQWVVSASHCFQGLQNPTVHVRGNSLSWLSGPSSDTARVSTVITHPEFRELQINGQGSGQFFNDVALLRLENTLPNTAIGSLSSCRPSNNTIAYAVGWGARAVTATQSGAQGTNFPQTLHYVDLPIADLDRCDQQLYDGILEDSQHVCAGSVMGGKDSCFGDSGGPLVQAIDGTFSVVGLTSFGSVFCGSFNNIGVYTRLGEYIDWIESNSGLQVLNNNARCEADPYDSDGDFVPDYIEQGAGSNSNNPQSFIDSDGDGVPAYIEGLHRTSDLSSADFLDTNRNGVADYREIIDGGFSNNPNSVNIGGRGDGGQLSLWFYALVALWYGAFRCRFGRR